jgi:hypothetical protein
MDQSITFELELRYYLTCFIVKTEIETIKKRLDEKLRSKGTHTFTKIEFNILSDFIYGSFDTLGYFEIHLERFSHQQQPDVKELIELSNIIGSFIGECNTEYTKYCFFDAKSHPYVLTIAVNSSIGDIEWEKDNVLKYKKELGRWIEFYSGQWEDYSDELYLSRIEHNLSNRLSEVHFIRNNSAFIYMPIEGFEKYMPYMEQYFIEQVIRVRSLLFCYAALNDELDKLDPMSLSESPLTIIEKALDKVEDLDTVILQVSSKIVEERLTNRRSHSQKVLNLCFDLFGIETARSETEKKLKKIQAIISAKQASEQRKLSDQQNRWIMILNVLLGSQIAFTLKDKVFEFVGIGNENPLYELIDGLFLLTIGLIVVVAVGGILYTWLSKRWTVKSLRQKNVK